jgi:hypothetical protein
VGNLVARHRTAATVKGWGRAACECWRRLYVEGADPEEALAAFSAETSSEGVAASRIRRQSGQLKRVAAFERLCDGFPEVY